MTRTEHWIERTAENRMGMHLAYDDVPVPHSYDPREDLEKVFAGGGVAGV